MKNLFAENNPILQLLSLLADLMILTLQWLVACIPVVTVGGAVRRRDRLCKRQNAAAYL